MRHQPERAAAGQLAMRDFRSSSQTADPGVLATPVELECLTVTERQRCEGAAVWSVAKFLARFPNTHAVANVAAAVTLRLDRLDHDLRRAAIPPGSMTIGFKPAAQLI